MSSIETYLKRITLDDKAVYWPSPTPSADGSNTFGDPIEINVFWDGTTDLIRDNKGREVVVRAEVYVTQDLDSQGMLYHGTLNDLTAEQKADPRKVKTAHEIMRFLKEPSLYQKGEFNRTALLIRD